MEREYDPSHHASLAREESHAEFVGCLGCDASHPEVVYRICGSRYPSIEAFLNDLDSPAAPA
jgi:hypothetical protein